MEDKDKTKEQLIDEVAGLRRRITELEALEAERRKAEESLQKSEGKFRSLVDSTEDSIYVIDRHCRYLYINKKHLSRLGLTERQTLGRDYNSFHSPEETKEFEEKVNEVFNTGKSSMHEYNSRRDCRYFLQTFSPVKDHGGAITAVTIVSKDITDRKKVSEAILQSIQDWEDTFNSITDMITIHDRDFNIIRANNAAEKILGLPFLLPGTKCYKYYHGKDDPMTGCPSCDCLKTGMSVSFEMFEPYLNMFLEIRSIPRFDANKKLAGLLHVVRDISERKKMEEILRTMSITDELTGLLNRRGFFSLAQKQLKAAERSGRYMSVIYADLDGLKEINDTLGHKAGDAALLEFAELLKDTFRESDIIARLGGDEFAVVVEVTDANSESIIRRRLEDKLEAVNSQKDRQFILLISLGIVRYDPYHPCSIDELLSQSDKLMYANKKGK
ncbi:MAG: diguanylate cyclase [Nitrospirae bacterium]|nr:diguanylate cyclase [Nitrospirota bacterium]